MGHARQERTEIATSRSNVYGLLATVFRAEPSPEFLSRLRQSGVLDVLRDLDPASGDDLDAELASRSADELAAEFTRLFIGPRDHISPHESVHAVVDGREAGLWGARTVEVKKFIEAAGLTYDDDFTGLPDHISAELEFLQKVTTREAEHWSEGNEEGAETCLTIQRQFLSEHLGQWAPAFCDRVVAAASRPFYGEIAKLTKAFIEFEIESIDIAPSTAG